MPMRDFVEGLVRGAGRRSKGPTTPPPYLFEAEFVSENPDFRDSVRAIVDVVKDVEAVEITNYDQPRVQFYLGGVSGLGIGDEERPSCSHPCSHLSPTQGRVPGPLSISISPRSTPSRTAESVICSCVSCREVAPAAPAVPTADPHHFPTHSSWRSGLLGRTHHQLYRRRRVRRADGREPHCPQADPPRVRAGGGRSGLRANGG